MSDKGRRLHLKIALVSGSPRPFPTHLNRQLLHVDSGEERTSCHKHTGSIFGTLITEVIMSIVAVASVLFEI